MGKPLRVLIIEDSEDDTLLLVRKLKQGGFEPSYEQIQTADALMDALKEKKWDVVISDYAMPKFNGIAALKIFKDSNLDIPFIIVSGTIGEDLAVLAMREGAHDYLMKDKLERLVPALERELSEAEMRRARRQAEEERRQLRERLQQAQKMEAVGTLARGIAHDFNNILFSMIGFTEMALEDMEPNSHAATCLEQAMIAQKRASNLVEQILTFSRQEALESKPMQLQSVISETLKLLRGSLPANIKVQEKVDPACGPVRADPTQMHQILMNLCTNAMHAMGETGGVLEVELHSLTSSDSGSEAGVNLKPGEYASLRVTDTGHGMDEETQHRIFEPYFTTKGVGDGTGLGLSTVHGIVRKFQGSIHVESVVGEGTTFRIFLPICTMKADPREGMPETAKRGRESILFVDDEEQVTLFVKMALKDQGYRIHARTSSVEALEAFRTRPDGFDMVITDQAMPNMTGVQMAREMLTLRPEIPILLCTGLSDETLREEARKIGIRECINKPILIRDLTAAIQRLLHPEDSAV